MTLVGLRDRQHALTSIALAQKAVTLLVITCGIAISIPWTFDGFVDLSVYRAGGQAWWQGFDLYVRHFAEPLGGGTLPFTYPPIAAVLFSGLAILPWQTAVILLITLSSFAAFATIVLVNRKRDHSGIFAPFVLAVVSAIAVTTEPVVETFGYGQINLLIMVLIVADCLYFRKWLATGVLTGVAAALKLTPLVFVLFFIAGRQWRAAGVSLATFAFLACLGFVLAPDDSTSYWFGALLDPDRVGGATYGTNQSVRGALARLGLQHWVHTILWIALSIMLLAVAWLAIVGLRRRGDEVAALVITAALGLAISPVSWSHHWVWSIPALVYLAHHALQTGGRLWWALLVSLSVAFLIGPHRLLPLDNDRELSWSIWQHLIGDTYLWVAVFAVVLAAALNFSQRWSNIDEIDNRRNQRRDSEQAENPEVKAKEERRNGDREPRRLGQFSGSDKRLSRIP